MNLNRREFLVGSMVAAIARPAFSENDVAGATDEGVPPPPQFTVGEPCLQAAGATTMGVAWAVSGLAKGVVEYADNPAFANARLVKSGGLGLVPIDDRALQVRLNGVNMLVMLAALITMLYIYPNFIFEKRQVVTSTTALEFNRLILISLVPAVSLYLANMFIKKDEKKVRAADRLR